MNVTDKLVTNATEARTTDTSTPRSVVSRRQFLQAGATVTFGVTAFGLSAASIASAGGGNPRDDGPQHAAGRA